MIKQYYNDYAELGLFPIGVNWDAEKKSTYHPVGWENATELFPLHDSHNGLMIRIDDDYGCLDFDLKNTQNKDIFNQWKAIVINTMPDVYDKLYIEETRNKGYHVWFKYEGLTHKTGFAKSEEGAEVIAVYCKRKLIYTFPTPGYSLYHQSMEDVGYLTSKEYQYLVETSQLFNEYKPKYDPNKKAVNYPIEHQDLLMKFDKVLSDENFTQILNEIGLEQVHDFRYKQKDSFVAFKRKGSEALYSAKVYFKTKRMMLFTASMPEYPSWHDKEEYEIWSLPPSFILFYKNNRDWDATIEVCKMILEAQGEDLPQVENEIKFPFDIFPETVRESIFEVAKERSMSPEFLATAGIWAVASLAGSVYHSDIRGANNILFCFLVAPMSVGKSPAYDVMWQNPMKPILEQADREYDFKLKEWEIKRKKEMSEKKFYDEPKPKRIIPILKDGTTEGYTVLCMHQPSGIGVYVDEAEEIMNAASHKTTNNSISFFTTAFNGGRYGKVLANRDNERVVQNLNISLLLGTQTDRLSQIFTSDTIVSGFASRFLMCESDYILLNEDVDPFSKKGDIHYDWVTILETLYHNQIRYNTDTKYKIKIQATDQAVELYTQISRDEIKEANKRIKNRVDGYILGTHAKMSNYFGRLTQVVAIMQNPVTPVIDANIVRLSHRLYKYYSETTIRLIGQLKEKADTGLPKDLNNLYDALPDSFTRKEAVQVCLRINLNERKFDSAIRNANFAKLFIAHGSGKYTKK
jgi:hypothetical protein